MRRRAPPALRLVSMPRRAVRTVGAWSEGEAYYADCADRGARASPCACLRGPIDAPARRCDVIDPARETPESVIAVARSLCRTVERIRHHRASMGRAMPCRQPTKPRCQGLGDVIRLKTARTEPSSSMTARSRRRDRGHGQGALNAQRDARERKHEERGNREPRTGEEEPRTREHRNAWTAERRNGGTAEPYKGGTLGLRNAGTTGQRNGGTL
jgi:hypothetical protein